MLFFTNNSRKVGSLATGRRRSNESGQALVEFVLIMTPMLVLLLLAIQYLLIWRANSYLQVAAYGAARKFAVNDNESLAKQVAMQYLKGIVSEDQVSLQFSDDSPGFADPFTATVSIEYPLLGVPLIDRLFSTEEETIVHVGAIQTTEGSSPPTADSLGLAPDQRVEILDSKFIGLTAQMYLWWGRIHWHMDYYYPYKVEGKNHMGHNTWNNFPTWYIDSASQPTIEQVEAYYGDWAQPQLKPPSDCDCGLFWFPYQLLRVLNPPETYAKYDGHSPIGTPTPIYEFTYRVDTVATKPIAPNTITLSAGTVMNKED
jgi:TadE-like protein